MSTTQAPPTPMKAYLTVEGNDGQKVDDASAERIECWFNPTSFTRNRGASLTREDKTVARGENNRYVTEESETIALSLVLHAGEVVQEGGKPTTGSDLEGQVKKLVALTEPTVTADPKYPQKRPPKVMLHWGAFKSVAMWARSVDISYELFDVSGTPLRAVVNLSLSQAETEPGKGKPKPGNPTTRAIQQRRAHIVAPGDNLHLIAHSHLRDPTMWREIAKFNDLADPLRIRPGDVLVIPTDRP